MGLNFTTGIDRHVRCQGSRGVGSFRSAYTLSERYLHSLFFMLHQLSLVQKCVEVLFIYSRMPSVFFVERFLLYFLTSVSVGPGEGGNANLHVQYIILKVQVPLEAYLDKWGDIDNFTFLKYPGAVLLKWIQEGGNGHKYYSK